MTALTHDTTGRSGLAPGFGFAVVSAGSFGLSGALARGLLDSGWSAAAAVTVRVLVAGLVLTGPALVVLRGRWGLVRRNARVLLTYGLVAVAGCQLCYFEAVGHMEVGVALLIEYTAPAAVVTWLWVRHDERPGPVTLAGAGLAVLGLVLVLDLLSGADVSLPGVLWALGAMIGAATYFVVSADTSNGLPPLVLATGGLLVGAGGLLAAGAVGLLDLTGSTAPASYDGRVVAWWVPLLALALVTAALAYTTGIAAGRRLGSRLASFVALLEVVAALGFAWLLLAELPGPVQLAGGILVLAGVVVVKSGEGRTRAVSGHPVAG